jgi:hypothetical protein
MALNRFTVVCPLDGLTLAVLEPFLRGETPSESTKHLHLDVDQTATCAVGHSWHLEGGLVVERMS